MRVERQSPCKVNIVLNVLGRRNDGFHEVETLMQPLPIRDTLTFDTDGSGVELTCSIPDLPTDSQNLAFRAAAAFFKRTGIKAGIRIHLEKRLPLAAGLGGGSANAGTTLLALNEIHGNALSEVQLHQLAAELGSDVPFFLQSGPALATGRGEIIQPLEPFQALSGAACLLVHPGFGISTAWTYQNLKRFPEVINGKPGRAARVISLLRAGDLRTAGSEMRNSLEAPVLEKFPLLRLFQEFFREGGAFATLMSGSGSSTFALLANKREADDLAESFKSRFGASNWVQVATL